MVSRYLLMGLVFGVGMSLFAALTVWLARRPDPKVLYHPYFRLSLISGSLCVLCADEVYFYLTVNPTLPRALFVCCVAAGIGLGTFTVFLIRWRRRQNGLPETAGQGETRRYDWRITAAALVAAFVLWCTWA
jgi:hypothetical protein